MLDLILIAFALAMDSFAVSVVCGVILRRRKWDTILKIAFLFGLFQGAMPVIGWALTKGFASCIESFDHWLAFGLLAFMGGKMIADSFKEEEDKSINPEKTATQFALAIATSIDALAMGITFACTGYNTLASLRLPFVVIAAVSFGMSLAGSILGIRYGSAVIKKVHPELVGGLILIAIGVKILIEHLFQ